MSKIALQEALNERRAVYEEFAACVPDSQENINRGEALLADLGRRDSAIKILEAQVREDEKATAIQPAAADPVDARGDGSTTRDGVAVDDYSRAFTAFLRYGMNGMETEEKTALRKGFIDGKEFRAAGIATGAAGGYFVPQAFRAKIIEALKAYGAVREVAEVVTTDTGATLPWPTNDDTANVGAILAENTQVTEQDVVIGQAQLGAFMYTSKLVRVSLQLLQDSAFNVETWLSRKLGERLGRATNAHFTTGTGAGAQPSGVVTGAAIGKTGTTGQTLTVIYNDLIDLIHSIDPAYRNANSRFMAHDLSTAIIRKIRDDSGGAGLGRPIWEPSLQIGQPDTLLGYPWTFNNDMPVMAANAKSILFGDFQTAYVIREVLGIQQLRLEERYADFLQVGFLAFMRTDGVTQDANAVKAYKNSAT